MERTEKTMDAVAGADSGIPPETGALLDGIVRNVRWSYVLGFSLLQTWTVLCIALPDPVTYGEPFHDLRWLSLLTAFVTSVLAVCCTRVGRALQASGRAFICLGALAAVASLLGPLSALLSRPFSVITIAIAALGVGTGFAALYIAWYARFCAQGDMMGLAFSVIASLLLIYPFANVLATNQINPWVSSVLGSSLPLVSALLGAQGAGKDAPGTTAPVGFDSEALRSMTHEDHARYPRFMVCLLLIVTVVETIRNMLLGGTAIAFYSGVSNLGGAALKVACAGWLMTVFSRRDARGVSLAYRISYVLIICVVLCMPLLFHGNWMAHVLLDVGSFFFQMIALMVAYQVSLAAQMGSIRTFGAVRAVWALGTLMGIGFEPLRRMESMPDQVLPVILGVTAAVAFIFIFTDHDCIEVLANEPVAPRPEAGPDAFELKARTLAQHAGISKREIQVLIPLARGRSASWIAQDLDVSTATVNTHIHHVYQKLGVHSRQELIDLIERALE